LQAASDTSMIPSSSASGQATVVSTDPSTSNWMSPAADTWIVGMPLDVPT